MGDHICPHWLAFSLDNWIRRILHNPNKFISKYVEEGQTVIDIGCGPGYFTIPMAKYVGEKGRVIAVDLQDEMLHLVRKKADKKGLSSRIITRQCPEDNIGLNEQADFVLAFYMVHEVPDPVKFISEISLLLKPNGQFLVVEPKMHSSDSHFNQIIETATNVGLKPIGDAKVGFSRAQLFQLL